MLDRSNTKVAEQAFELFAPHRGARRELEGLLADSIRHANEEGTSCWEITLRPRDLVFNVGQVALLVVRPHDVDIYYRWCPTVAGMTRSSLPVGYKKRAIDAPIRLLTLLRRRGQRSLPDRRMPAV